MSGMTEIVTPDNLPLNRRPVLHMKVSGDLQQPEHFDEALMSGYMYLYESVIMAEDFSQSSPAYS